MTSYADMAETLRQGIVKVATHGQSFTLGTKTYTRANISELMKLEQYYSGLAKRDANGGGIQVLGAIPE